MIAEAKEQNWNFTTEFTESTENVVRDTGDLLE